MELKKGIQLIYLHLMLYHGKVHCCYFKNRLFIWNGTNQSSTWENSWTNTICKGQNTIITNINASVTYKVFYVVMIFLYIYLYI